MTALVWLLVKAQSPLRMLVIAACSALACTLLLVAVAISNLPLEPDERLFALVADYGTRGGVVLALVLLVAPVLMLLYQAVLLGSAVRNRRMAILRIIGATPQQVRLLGGAELGLPGLVGALGGVVLYLSVQVLLGGRKPPSPGQFIFASPLPGLIPADVGPTWRQSCLVLMAVVGIIVAMGWRVTRNVVRRPIAPTRRQGPAHPRPWGLVPLAVSIGGYLIALTHPETGTMTLLVLIALAAAGLMLLGPWTAYRAGTHAARRATTVEVLLGSRRLVTDPWAAGRAAAPVGMIGLVTGGTACIIALLIVRGSLELYYIASVVLVLVLLLTSLTIVALGLAVHAVETLSSNRRSTAVLAASGVRARVLEGSLRAESQTVALPTAVTGLVIGAASVLGLAEQLPDSEHPLFGLTAIVATLVALGATVLLLRIATTLAVRLGRPWLTRAMDPQALRTG